MTFSLSRHWRWEDSSNESGLFKIYKAYDSYGPKLGFHTGPFQQANEWIPSL